MTEIVSATHPDVLKRAAEVVRAGGVIAFPTDTVYGIGATPWLEGAVARLYDVKKRVRSKSIPLLLAGADYLDEVAVPEPSCRRVIEAFWPGGLTLIFVKTARVSSEISSGSTVAVRVPDMALARELIEASGGVLAVTSANVSGQPSPATAIEVNEQLGGEIELIIDGGPCIHGVSSSILDCTVTPPRLLRCGAVSEAALRSAIGEIKISTGE
jgi:L-threonylcarbamoyladenylate synthase